MALSLFNRIKEKALLKLGGIASNPTINKVANSVDGINRTREGFGRYLTSFGQGVVENARPLTDTLGKSLAYNFDPKTRKYYQEAEEQLALTNSLLLERAAKEKDRQKKEALLRLNMDILGKTPSILEKKYDYTPGQVAGSAVKTAGMAMSGGVINPKTIALSSLLGGIFNKLGGGDFAEGAGEGTARSLPYLGITSNFTTPLLSKLFPQANSRTAQALMNVGEGYGTSKLAGDDYTAPEAILDAVTGASLKPFKGAEFPFKIDSKKFPFGLSTKEVDEKGLEKVNVSTLDDFFKRTKDWVNDKSTDTSVKGERLGLENITSKLKDHSYSAAKLVDDMHEWFSRDSKNFDSDKFFPAIKKYVDELGQDSVRKVFEKYSNATKVAPDSKKLIWDELANLSKEKGYKSWKVLEKERLESLAEEGGKEVDILESTQPKGVGGNKYGVTQADLDEVEIGKTVSQQEANRQRLYDEIGMENIQEKRLKGLVPVTDIKKPVEVYRGSATGEKLKYGDYITLDKEEASQLGRLTKKIVNPKDLSYNSSGDLIYTPSKIKEVGGEMQQSSVKKTEDLIQSAKSAKRTITQKIDDFVKTQPLKKDVQNETAEVAYTNFKMQGETLIDDISNGIRQLNLDEKTFVKYIENPELAPDSIKPAIEAHKKLMKNLHSLRENPALGKLEDYFPRMRIEVFEKAPELQNIGKDLWISDYTMELGTSKKRTGSLIDFSTEYNKVMKNYIDQSAYDKYGKRINYDEKTAQFVDKINTHLSPDKEGIYKPPTDSFSYVDASAEKAGVEQKMTIVERYFPNDTFDNFARKLNNDPNGGVLSKMMIGVRDMRDKANGIMKKVQTLDTPGKIELLSEQLTYLGRKVDIKKNLLRLTNNGKDELSDSVVGGLVKTEKDFRLQAFIDEVGKYDFHKNTKKVLDKEIDRLTKYSKYEQSLLNKATNFISSIFYKAQIWGNIKTGLAQKMESTRLPVFYDTDAIKAGTKQRLLDKKAGVDILERYDFAGVETDISKQLGIPGKENLLKQIDEKVGKVGNFFVNVGENSKNRDFLYSAEAQGKKFGLSGDNLYTYVRNELFSNGFILHEFNTPEMLGNPLVRLGLQYQQYNIKMINKALELAGSGQYGKTAGLIGAQTFGAVLLAGLTGKALDSAFDRLFGVQAGPVISIPIQVANLIKEDYQNDNINNTDRLIKIGERNTIPFANQFFKTSDALTDINKGYGESAKGNINYPVGDLNPVQTAQAVLFGKSSIPNYKEAQALWDKKDKGESDIYPTLTAKKSEVFKSLPKDKQEAYYDKEIEKQGISEKSLANPKDKRGIFSIFQKDDEGTEIDKITEFYFSAGNATSETSSVRKDAFTSVKNVFEDPELPDEYKQKVLEASGITDDEWEYYQLASLGVIDKREKLVNLVESSSGDREELIGQLALLKRTVAENAVAGTSDFNYLYDMGYISKEEKKLLNAIRYDESTGEFYIDRDYKGSGGGLTNAQYRAIIAKLNSITNNMRPKKRKSSLGISPKIAIPEVKSALSMRPRYGTRTEDRWFNSY